MGCILHFNNFALTEHIPGVGFVFLAIDLKRFPCLYIEIAGILFRNYQYRTDAAFDLYAISANTCDTIFFYAR